jgi:type VI secretion system secreted protein VgrG
MATVTLSFESGESSLTARTFRIEESLSEPFSILIVARSPRSIDLETIVGRAAALEISGGDPIDAGTPHRWSGICHHIEQVRAEPTGLSTYELHLAPVLWLLGQRRGYRIHQHLTIPAIIDRILADWSITPKWRLSRSYPQLEYRVQYGESDLAFFTRLLEEAGITFTFEGTENGSTLTLDDAFHAGAARPRGLPFVDSPNEVQKEFATNLKISREMRPGAFAIRDYDFRRPTFALLGQATSPAAGVEERLEQFHYQPGHFLIEGAEGGDTPAADDRGVARYSADFGKARAGERLSSERVGRASITFRTQVLDLVPGSVFGIEDHPHVSLGDDRRLVVLGRAIDGAVATDWTFSSEVRATSAAEPHRPPRVTQKPIVDGVQTAIVVGASGQEIHTDEFGRVRVQFPWDREGASDERSSCWIRVSQGWGGTGFGLIHLPRIGQEVLVGFLEGDPDQPVVVGRVFNATNVTPYPLPKHQTRSTWKSNSSPGGDGFNEIMFEDQSGSELVWVQAQKDLRKLVNNDETVTVGHDRQKLVKGDETETVGGTRTEVTNGPRIEITKKDKTTVISGERKELVGGTSNEVIGGDRLESVGGDEDLVVGGSKRELVGGDRSFIVGGDRKEAVNGTSGLTAGSQVIGCGSQSVGASGTIYLKAGASIVIEAPDVTIKAPGGFVRVDGGGVTIQGTMVLINSGGSAGSGSGGGAPAPDAPKRAGVEMPVEPDPDDVSRSRLGPGR